MKSLRLVNFKAFTDCTFDLKPLTLFSGLNFNTEIHYLSSCAQSKPLNFDLLDRLAPGSMVLLEHPEHRLHPSLAAKLGGQIARAAARGVQIIVETHNDHLFNGIRVAVHGGQIKHENVGMFYFQAVNQQGRRVIEVTSPRIDRNGRIDRWEDGFFDQFDKDLEQLLEPVNV